MGRLGLVVLVVTLLTLLETPARAQESITFATAAEAEAAIEQAELDLTSQLSQSAGDCSAACLALGSMRRAADRLCQLEPGPRCEAARKRLEAARERVAERCPTCEALRESGKQPQTSPLPRPTPPPSPTPPPDDPDDDDYSDDETKAGRATKEVDKDQREQELMLTGEPVDAAAPPSEEATGGCAACTVGGTDDRRGLWALGLAALALAMRRR